MHNIRELVSLAHLMRQYGQETYQPSYRLNFYRAAAELEAQAALQATVLPENWPAPAEDEKLHQGIDITV